MRKVRVWFQFCGESFIAIVDVPFDYFKKDGTLDVTRLKNRLEAQPTVCEMTFDQLDLTQGQ